MPYTVNLASPKPSAWEFAKMCLFEDLRWADRAGVDVVVLHPGSHVGEGVAAGIERIVEAARPALEGYTGRTRLLFESMSGMGSEVGGRPEEIGTIIARLDRHPALGVCLDSCHQFASGFDLRTPAGVDALVAAWGDAVGLDRIGAMHLNDSKTGLESHKDRHELIGKGLLGEAGIRAVVTHPFLSTLPLCIETPVDDYADYAGEIARVREIAATPA
jgi:deoxyribonuclease-4